MGFTHSTEAKQDRKVVGEEDYYELSYVRVIVFLENNSNCQMFNDPKSIGYSSPMIPGLDVVRSDLSETYYPYTIKT